MSRNLLVALILTVLAVAAYALIVVQADAPPPQGIVALASWGLSFALLFLLGEPDLLSQLSERLRHPLALGAPALILFVPYLLLVLFTGQFTWWGLLGGLIILTLPTAAAIFNGPQETTGLTPLDGAVFLFLGLLMTWKWWPGAVYPGWAVSVQPVTIFEPLSAALAAYLMSVVRRTTNFGYHWRLSHEDGEWLATMCVATLALALPIGFASGVMTVELDSLDPAQLMGQVVRCVFVLAPPPTLLFQGVAQELVERRLGEKKWSAWAALAVGATLFAVSQSLALGLWSLGGLGMIATVGLCCSYVYLKTRKVADVALLYGLFLVVWQGLLGT